jgi:hypothetical protein
MYRLKKPVSAVTYYIQIEWSSPSNCAGDERAGDYNDETEDEDERSNEHERREKKKKDGATQTSLFASMYTLCPLADEFIDAEGAAAAAKCVRENGRGRAAVT